MVNLCDGPLVKDIGDLRLTTPVAVCDRGLRFPGGVCCADVRVVPNKPTLTALGITISDVGAMCILPEVPRITTRRVIALPMDDLEAGREVPVCQQERRPVCGENRCPLIASRAVTGDASVSVAVAITDPWPAGIATAGHVDTWPEPVSKGCDGTRHAPMVFGGDTEW